MDSNLDIVSLFQDDTDSYRKRLIILTFYDNRQDSSKLKLP